MACKPLYEHLENSPDIIVNGFKHAGIYKALNLLTDIDDRNLVNYSESSSEDLASDIEDNEVDNIHPTLLVSDVYSDSESESVIQLSSSDDNQSLAAVSAEAVLLDNLIP